jgi:hypothetical protein
MRDCALDISANCRACAAPLTLAEMHYLDHGDGTATCSECETKWMEACREWQASDDNKPMPKRP